MSYFRVTEEDLDGENWRLASPIFVTLGATVVTVPEGFVTDFASTPFGIGAYGKTNLAAIVHDFLYRSPDLVWNRYFADSAFYDLMILQGVSRRKALFYYYSVKAFGWKAWNAYR